MHNARIPKCPASLSRRLPGIPGGDVIRVKGDFLSKSPVHPGIEPAPSGLSSKWLNHSARPPGPGQGVRLRAGGPAEWLTSSPLSPLVSGSSLTWTQLSTVQKQAQEGTKDGGLTEDPWGSAITD